MRLYRSTTFRFWPCYLGAFRGWHGLSWLGFIWEWPVRDWRAI